MESVMKLLVPTFALAAALVAHSALAAPAMPKEGMVKCASCHAVDHKLVGPAYMDVAKKYKGDPNAVAKITASITKGGAFGWKLGVMPPRGLAATDAEIKVMATFIAGLAN